MTHYFKTGNKISIEPSDALEVLDNLPAATYVVKKNPVTQKLFLQTTNDFELPPKLYGNPSDRATRIINTFRARVKSTGVLLSGDKGSGKTLLSKLIAIKMIEQNMPVVIINEPWCGPEFNDLIGNIRQPAMVIFDEFDKVYNENDQQQLLTLLDGTVETKKLFVLTTNAGHVDPHLINRPGRIYYRYHYDGLDENFVREYAADTLKSANIDELVTVTNAFGTMTFDMLQAIIEEMNRYGESAQDVMNHINVDVTQETIEYDIKVVYDGKKITNNIWPVVLDHNPLFSVNNGRGRGRDLEIYSGDDTTFGSEDVKNLPDLYMSQEAKYSVSKGGVITFFYEYKGKDLLVILSKQERSTMHWGAF